MKKITMLAALTILCFTFMSWPTCEAEDEIRGCAKIENGQLRILDDYGECNPSEPLRVCRRVVRVSQATLADPSEPCAKNSKIRSDNSKIITLGFLSNTKGRFR